MPKVIVVDDDQTNVTLLKMLLEMDGFVTVACVNIPEAISSAGPDTDAFVIDCHLARGVSGLDLLSAVRNGETNAPPDTIVIVTSGDYRCQKDALEADANLFLAKPYPPTTVTKAINDLLSKDGINGE